MTHLVCVCCDVLHKSALTHARTHTPSVKITHTHKVGVGGYTVTTLGLSSELLLFFFFYKRLLHNLLLGAEQHKFSRQHMKGTEKERERRRERKTSFLVAKLYNYKLGKKTISQRAAAAAAG